MRKNNIFLEMKYLLIIPAVFAFVFALARDARAVPDPPPLEVISSDPLFAVSNAAPGESFSSQVKILNHGGDSEDFQFEIQVKTNPKALADRLTFKINNADDTACFFGCAGDIKISDLDGKELKVNEIGPHSTNIYNFILTFDVNAGNEFQAADISFDIKLGYKGEAADGDGDGGGDGGAAGGAAGGVAGAALFAAGLPAGGAVAGEQIPAEEAQPGEVKGEEAAPGEVEGAEISLCQGWPKWVWVLMLIAYFAAFLWRTFDKFKEQVEKREIRWKWQAVLAAAAFLIWYFFDKCREFWWFVIIALVGGAAIYLLYLYLFRKNIREEHAKVESGSGQDAPKNPTGQSPPTTA